MKIGNWHAGATADASAWCQTMTPSPEGAALQNQIAFILLFIYLRGENKCKMKRVRGRNPSETKMWR